MKMKYYYKIIQLIEHIDIRELPFIYTFLQEMYAEEGGDEE